MLILSRGLVHARIPLEFSILSANYNSFNKDLAAKYFLVVFALSYMHSSRVDRDNLVNLTQ